MSDLIIPSTSWVPAPLVACLLKADDFLGPNRVWKGKTKDQLRFLSQFDAISKDLSLLSEDEFKSVISANADEINAWLSKNGFDIEIDPLAANEFATAAIVRLAAEWVVKGTAIDLRMENGENHPGVLMREGAFYGFNSSAHPYPIARIPGKNGSEWNITKATDSRSDLALYDHLTEMAADLRYNPAEMLKFPKVDYDETIEPEVVIGLATEDVNGAPWVVSECQQQTRIKMNEFGGLAESAAAMTMRSLSVRISPPPIVIDGPMWLWISKPGMTLPLFTAQLGYDVLKDPGTIEFNRPVLA